MSCSVPYVPMVVAAQSFLNRTASIAATTLYTPSADGTFRVSVYSEITTTSGGGCPLLSWVDDFNTHTNQSLVQVDGGGACINSGGSGTPNYGWATWIVRATSGNAISFSFPGSTTTPVVYSIYVTVEQL